MPAPYIPNRDTDLLAWSANFSTLISASPGTYGLAAGDATAIATQNTGWAAAYALAVNPSTRTPTTIANKDTAKINLLAVERPYAQRIANNAGVLSSDKIALGLNPRTNTPTKIPRPVTNPVLTIDTALTFQHVIRARDSLASPTVKAKPFGALQLELHGLAQATGSPTLALDLWPVLASSTKTPSIISWSPTNVAQTAFYAARWITRTGLTGPFSPVISFTIAG